MGLFKRLGLTSRRPSSHDNNEDADMPNLQQQPKKSVISLVPLSEVTEESLKVWRQLPGSIRHDPSMISFQQEHDRWKGELKSFLLLPPLLNCGFFPKDISRRWIVGHNNKI